ncbi:MAG: UDP-N-acetylglucosamine--N-acetylmuramyl-(pentapeptide) pyrophosphoryl-undecaprenol N-acetylglucosamine transferase [Candidatus Gracilibacteria bacterium]|nr:UDP-N-acetylglucosamine--N-acetylmuramyl-(pentapeptide) pyrophosphoryl-undecaprenol N-acetylglucosamine transferase [Candidatus Gracilibacteria bacterium]
MEKQHKKHRILFTGGGTTGHVMKNLILIEELDSAQPHVDIHYAGLSSGKEAELIDQKKVTFHPVSSGKLRRYFDVQNFVDFFRFLRGTWQSFWLVRRIKPNVVFSSGGFVALPVAIGAWMNGVPVVSHETDSYPGLANRLIAKFAKKICLGFQSAEQYLPVEKVVYTGNPISPALLEADGNRGLDSVSFPYTTPTLLVTGGSQGAQQINNLVLEILPKLVESYQIIHLTGKGKATGFEDKKYREFEYVTDQYASFLAAADVVLTRSGGSVSEIEALGKRAIMIPLPAEVAAGDHQRKNAEEMVKRQSDWIMLDSATVSSDQLLKAIQKAFQESSKDANNPSALEPQNRIIELLGEYLK